ncbi:MULTISPECIES: hypothetical protein [unclassified Oleiphilus]|uniref:hypothetical protein n=2 Tax=Oleiphilus TaxID=141450 RepID=UPI0007C2B823|nr:MULTISPECIES: hypothetical protein [unclassified Oleiphilus]KZY41277.1 hypothetical protein A3732_18450 [Oleiphilus sp. HI0050]KZZ33807.1 hypothetical protein A3757_18805 [Oleiphilus sp. HI0117]KZZ34334.1 hypothetical protein A3756_17970 [Oleiphilus sp. HI0086]
MDIVNKSTQKHFWLSFLIASLVSAAAYQWLLILMGVWVFFIMGGVTFIRSVNQKVFSILWGMFFGLTFALALLIFGPWELYT